jgi:hypothetical protein
MTCSFDAVTVLSSYNTDLTNTLTTITQKGNATLKHILTEMTTEIVLFLGASVWHRRESELPCS